MFTSGSLPEMPNVEAQQSFVGADSFLLSRPGRSFPAPPEWELGAGAMGV
jgi:hypothetical protein